MKLTFCFSVIFLSGLVSWCNAQDIPQQKNSITSVIEEIRQLENKRDPKCYATASRLEDFIYGTPLSSEARFAKISLQKELILKIWNIATLKANAEKGTVSVTKDYISHITQQSLNYSKEANGDWKIILQHRKAPIIIKATDKRQYSTIAYALRAILCVQQDAIVPGIPNLLPLDDGAIRELKEFLDIFTLAALNISDKKSRLNDEYEISKTNFIQSWNEVRRSLRLTIPDGQIPAKTAPSKVSKNPENRFSVLKQIIKQKVLSYEAYNKISIPVFLRNLQVYFARHRWPSDTEKGKEFKIVFTNAMVFYANDLLIGAEKVAVQNKHNLIRVEDVSQYANRFVPHELNEYEDAIFFPNLPSNERITIEAYDMDAFRDGGIHWKYLQTVIEDPKLPGVLDIDPFAAELLVENIAQFGVLVLRVTGNIAKAEETPRLEPAHIDKALRQIQDKMTRHAKASPVKIVSDSVVSSHTTSASDNKDNLFTEVSTHTGLFINHRSSDWLSRLIRSYVVRENNIARLAIPPAFGGSGVAAEDINNDGYPDVLLLSGGGNKLFINDQKGGFQDITKKSGINWVRDEDGLPGEPRQPIIADFDNDGLQDIFITYVKDNHRLYRNLGKGIFKDVSDTSGLGGKGFVGGPATVFDFDRDGLLDIYIGYFGNYTGGTFPTLARRNVNGLPNKLFKNIDGMSFKDVTKGSGVDNRGWTQAMSHTDFDLDGWQDIIVGNDFGVNAYYRNLGNGTFENVADKIGTGKPSFTMNVGIADLNSDKYPDIYISNIVTMDKDEKYIGPDENTPMKFDPKKMANMRVIEANDLFMSHTSEAKFDRYILSNAVTRGLSSTGWAWGADFFDFDNDGDDDLYCVNGMNEYSVYSSVNPYFADMNDVKRAAYMPVSEKESNVFFINEDGKLKNVSKKSGADFLGNSRSAAYLDYDLDGDLDIVVNNYHDGSLFYRNNSERFKNNWIKVKLIGDPGKKCNRDAIGAKILVTTPDKKVVWREIHGSIGYLSVHHKQQHIGLGKQKKADINIQWPNGDTSVFTNLDANHSYVIRHKEGLSTQ